MRKIKTIIAASLLSGAVHASGACDGFEIKIKNNLAEDLIARKIHLLGAEIQPGGIQKLSKKSEETFTVNKATENSPLSGEIVFNTLSLPSKEIRIQFDLSNTELICKHTDKSPKGELSLSKMRLPGKVLYTIDN